MAVQVDEPCHKDMIQFSLSCSFFMTCSIELNYQFAWAFWTLSSQLPLPAIFLLLMKSWCLLTKTHILHHTNQSYRCEDWNIKTEDMSHPQCHIVVRDQFTLSLCNHELECLSFSSFPQYQTLNCHLYHDAHGCACTVSNPPKISCWFVDQYIYEHWSNTYSWQWIDETRLW